MSILTLPKAFVGLDYDSSFVQVCALDKEGNVLVNQRCENDCRAITGLVRSRVGQSPVFAAIEACCGTANLADELVTRCGWSVDQAHPGPPYMPRYSNCRRAATSVSISWRVLYKWQLTRM